MKQHTTAEGIRYVETPGRLAELRSDVAVPVLQAAAIAGALGLAVGILAALWIGPGRDLAGLELWSWAGRLAATASAIALLVAIVVFVLQHRKVLLSIEEWTGRDLDGDHQVGKPEPPRVRVELHDQVKQQTRYVDLPVSELELRHVAIACLHNGRAFSRPALAGILSQRKYNALAKEMVRRGLAHRLSGNRRVLSAAGRACLRRVLGE
ncbi:hypothetical protein KKH23_10310 [Patescibacteria group bacterium]|nr:hypothetical protein [Patescibacteria group bacterium]MBU0847566.1 hypothetical protein [Patescibacteria group bacterium]